MTWRPRWERLPKLVEPDWLPVPGSEWVRRDQRPEPEDLCRVWMPADEQPAPGEELRLLFMPVLSALNGWPDHPEEIAQSGVASCVAVRRIDLPEPAHTHRRGTAWEVRVVAWLGVPELAGGPLRGRLSPRDLDFSIDDGYPNVFLFAEYGVVSLSAQGYAGLWLLLDRRHILPAGQWDPEVAVLGPLPEPHRQ